MNAIATGPNDSAGREPVLDAVDRVSEMCFGLFMALTFVGAVSAATAGNDAGRTMLYAALGCNLAWGLVDAAMYLVRTLTNRGKRLSLALAARAAPDPEAAKRIIRAALPPGMRSLVGGAELDAMLARLAAAQLPDRPRLGRDDLAAALGIFLIVVLSTIPVALPFVLLGDVSTALVISRVLTLAMLFGGGMALGRHAGRSGWQAGLGMVGVGVGLTVIIIALGG